MKDGMGNELAVGDRVLHITNVYRSGQLRVGTVFGLHGTNTVVIDGGTVEALTRWPEEQRKFKDVHRFSYEVVKAGTAMEPKVAERLDKLDRLEANGVDNWQGYEEAMRGAGGEEA